MKAINYYDFDLDLPGDKRWAPIIDDYQDSLPTFLASIRSILDSYGSIVTLIKPLVSIMPRDKIMFYDEICYIANRVGVEFPEALLLQLIYETSSACTATILKVNGQDFFFRTMDWPLLFLKDYTIGLNVKKGGKIIGKVTTWLGYVGFLTATNMVQNYTLTVNYRRTQDMSIACMVKNLYRTLSMSWPIGYLVRDIIESAYSVPRAEIHIEKSELITPCYVTFYIPNKTSRIFTRDCDKLVSVRTTELIQTNCDVDKTEPNILYSLERVEYVKHVQKIIDESDQWKSADVLELLLQFPVLNEETIYTHYQFGDEFETIV